MVAAHVLQLAGGR